MVNGEGGRRRGEVKWGSELERSKLSDCFSNGANWRIGDGKLERYLQIERKLFKYREGAGKERVWRGR